MKIMNGNAPIYDILMIENANQELIYSSGKHSGFPDMGATNNVGFYYSLEDAVNALQGNMCDLRETVYDAAFILIRQPGLYRFCSNYERIYFLWDEEKQGYYEAEEPKIFAHIAL